MNYDFPIIETLDDLLPAIAGRPEFVVAEKEGYTVVNYNVNFEDTFPPVNESYFSGMDSNDIQRQVHYAAMRRECRGIIFDTASRKIIRRPYHKFFNVNEREETLETHINLSQQNEILEKLDGSMIAPFYVGDNLIWGTKMGDTDVAKPVQLYVADKMNYLDLAYGCIVRGYTPIFEWCSRKQRIVMDYPEDQLVLTAIRHMRTGNYMSLDIMQELYSIPENIPQVKSFDPQKDMNAFVQYVHGLQDLEGFVVRFNNGHMVKLKCHWYVQIHKAKEAILQDRNVVDAIFNNNIDDIKAHLPQEDRDRLIEFENKLHDKINYHVGRIGGILDFLIDNKIDRKEFALNHATSMDGYTRQLVFKLWGHSSEVDTAIYHEVQNVIKNNLNNTAKYNTLKNSWFDGVAYNA